MAIRTLTPNTVKAATEYNYLAASDLAEGLHKPDVNPMLVQRYGRQDVTGLMDMLGQKKAVNALEFHHYEKDRLHGVTRVNSAISSASAAGSAEIAFTVNTGYNVSYSGQSPYPTGDTFTAFSTPSKNDIIEVKGVQFLVTAVNGSAYSAVAANSSAALPAIATSDDIIILGSANPEASTAPESRSSRLLSYTNYLQTLRRSHKVTGFEKGVKTWIEATGKDGQKGYFWYLEGIADEYHRFLNEREAILLAGQKITNLAGLAGVGTNSTGDANSIVTTNGMIPQISAEGTVENYTGGSFALADIENMVKNLQKYRGARENHLFVGHNLKLELDRLFKTEFPQGAIQFKAFNGISNQEVRYSFDGFEYGGFKFATKVLDIFSDPSFLGYAGGIYQDLGIVAPMGNTVTYNSANASTGVTVPTMEIKYLDSDDGSRYMKEWITGLGAGVATSDEDAYSVHFLSQVGLELYGLNRYGLFTKTA